MTGVELLPHNRQKFTQYEHNKLKWQTEVPSVSSYNIKQLLNSANTELY